MANNIEKQIIEIIAWDRIDRPISSMSGKLKRTKPSLASALDLSGSNNYFEGKRVHARIVEEDKNKARGLKEGLNVFKQRYPKYGEILKGIIQEERVKREKHLYFGVNEGCRLSSEDYMSVMEDLGFTKYAAYNLYPELMDISRKLGYKRDEKERSILF